MDLSTREDFARIRMVSKLFAQFSGFIRFLSLSNRRLWEEFWQEAQLVEGDGDQEAIRSSQSFFERGFLKKISL